jgi:hypothetical protein
MFRPPTTPHGCHPAGSVGSAFQRPRTRYAASCTAPYSRSLLTLGCKLSTVGHLFAFSSFHFELSTFNISPLSPFPATLTSRRQLNENKVTLSPAFAILTGCVRHKSFVCHSYKKCGGGAPWPKQISVIDARRPFKVWQKDALSASFFLHRLLRHEDALLESVIWAAKDAWR